MKKHFTRRKFIQAAALTTTGVMLPSVAGTTGFAEKGDSRTAGKELPKRRLGRTNRMVSCIGFGAGSRYCSWVASDEILQNHIDHAINLGIT